MPILSIPVPELESHIYYPVCKQLAHKVLYDLNIHNIIGNNIFIETGFSQPKNYHDGFHNAKLNINKLKVQADINVNPSSLKWDSISFQHTLSPGLSHTNLERDAMMFFFDPISNIKLSELYLPTYIQLNCTLTILDRNIAYQVPSMIFRHYPPNIPGMEHISYDYPIPKPTIALLYTLWKLKRYNQYKLPFRQWLIKHTSRHNIQFDINRVANKEELVMSKNLIDCVYLLEYNDNKPNEVQINRSISQYDLNFVVHIQFNRPDTVIMDYPIVIDNRLLPGKLIPDDLHKSEPLPQLIGPYPANIVDFHLYFSNLKNKLPMMIRFPDYDEWKVPNQDKLFMFSYRPWFSCVFTMDEDNDYTSLPIGEELDDELGYRLHPIVLLSIMFQGKRSFDIDCLFNLSVYLNNLPVEVKDYLDINDDLEVKVKSIFPLYIRRLVVSEIQDYRYLHPDFIMLLCLIELFLIYLKENNISIEEFYSIFKTLADFKLLYNRLYEQLLSYGCKDYHCYLKLFHYLKEQYNLGRLPLAVEYLSQFGVDNIGYFNKEPKNGFSEPLRQQNADIIARSLGKRNQQTGA